MKKIAAAYKCLIFSSWTELMIGGGGHLHDVLVILDEHERYKGIVTYERLLNYPAGEEILKDVLVISESFWEKGKNFFAEHPNELVPVTSLEGSILGFCWNDEMEFNVDDPLNMLEECYEEGNLLPIDVVYPNVRMACIYDCNEYAWKCYQFFLKIGLPVCVIGEAWEWFGIKNLDGFYAFPKWAKLSIYAEGADLLCDKEHKRHTGFTDWTEEWCIKQRRNIYQTWIRILKQKGVSYCCCMIPQDLPLNKRSEQEVRNFITPVNFPVANYIPEHFTDIQMKALRETVDNEEELEYFLNGKESIVEKRQKGLQVCFNNGIGYFQCIGSSYRKRVYVIGLCTVLNGYLAHNKLIGALQKHTEKEGYTVVGSWGLRYPKRLQASLMKLPIRKQDIVVILDMDVVLKGIDEQGIEIDLRKLYEQPNRKTWIYDTCTAHINSHGNYAVAKEIYEKYVREEIRRLKAVSDNEGYLLCGEILDKENRKKVQNYVAEIKKLRDIENLHIEETDMAPKKTIGNGAIVMNCNPFTYGHQYLIEYAAKKVEVLYIFVVEENLSEFSFAQRMKMVKAGCCHLKNVCVVPSGKWVLSYKTFSAYFEKSIYQEKEVDAWMDLEIFARYIAPSLEINQRFVGEEPTDKVTQQYNEQMKEILPYFHIKVEEIPRKQKNGQVISASYVRKCLREGKIEEIKRFVPESSVSFCLE